MNKFVKAAHQESNVAYTENGQKLYASTLDANLDFFSKSGNVVYNSVLTDFKNAYAENKDLAIRNLLHMRDIRGGKGVRTNSRTLLTYLANTYPNLITNQLLDKFVEVGRWDDIFEILKQSNSIANKQVVNYICQELIKAEPNKLLCKWLPRKSVSPSKAKTNYDVLPKIIQQRLKLTPKEYRKLLVNNTQVVETKMCANQWDSIEYQTVPSVAHKIYSKAFKRHAEEQYTKYLTKVEDGELKINSSVLYPHEIIANGSITKTQELQWQALPNYMPEGISILPLVDVSGSMTNPAYSNYSAMDIAVAMGIYLAERNKSAYKDLFITFTSVPKFVSLTDSKTLDSKLNKVKDSPWGMSTNLSAAFDLILDTAIKNKVSAKDMPQALLILTDIHMDESVSSIDTSYLDSIKQKFAKAGYKCPLLVWWNILASNMKSVSPVVFDDKGTALVSGYSPSIIKSIFNVDFENFTPENVMKETLMNPRYDWQ